MTKSRIRWGSSVFTPTLTLTLALLVINTADARLNFGLGSKLRFPIPSELACENYPIVLRCPGTDVIEVMAAEYGRQNTETCATSTDKMRNIHCYMPEALGIMQEKCNNKTTCKVTVSDQHFNPNPCPGTYKYLHVTFNCVKYMFGCPGTLSGIGSNVSLSTSMRPQAGSWSKDPIYNPGHVFFIPSDSRTIQEYDNTEQFLQGEDASVYDLPFRISGTSYVIYDGNIFYIKANSRHIVKYSMLARLRIREGAVPGFAHQPGSSMHGSMAQIKLEADEQGLWAVYGENGGGLIEIAKFNKDTLSIEKTWTTSFKQNSAMHTFLICGVLYVVGHQSGNVDYTYNTNVAERQGHHVTIGFDRNRALSPSDPVGLRAGDSPAPPKRRFAPLAAGLLARGRSFRAYNLTSLKYNPREQLLYAWDATGSNAVYYKLHFRLPMPEDANKPTTTTTVSTISTTTRRRPPIAPHTPPPFIPVRTTSARPGGKPSAGASTNFNCPPGQKNGISWPQTAAGTVSSMPCPNGVRGEAQWRCEIDRFTEKVDWSSQGPDMSRCLTWINDLEQRLEQGQISPSTAVEDLSRDLSDSSDSSLLRSDEISNAARVMKRSSQMAQEARTPLSTAQVQQLNEGITRSADTLISWENSQSWKRMSATTRHTSANDVIESVGNAGFLLADDVAGNVDSESLTETGVTRTSEQSDVFVQVKVQRVPASTSQQRHQPVTFPDPLNTNRLSAWSRITDRIVMPRQNLNAQASQGVSKAVFAVFNNLGEFADAQLQDGAFATTSSASDVAASEQWKVNSRIISASLGRPGNRVFLTTPVRILLENKQEVDVPRKCVYWSYSESERQGSWNSDGCHVTVSNRTHTECSCDHLTSFAVLVNVAGVQVSGPVNELALDIITSVGICISLVCLVICMITFAYFRNLQSDRNTIHKHLCLSLFVAELVFLVGIKQTAHRIPCAVIAGILHYSFLAAFMWMALEGFQLYVMLVEVFEGRSRWKWYYFTGYGIPAVIVGVSAVVDSSGYGGPDACWLKVDSGFIWSFVGPVCAVILCNLVFLAITVFKMYRHTLAYTDSSKVNAIKASVRGASVLLCLLGITWAFGILWVWEQAPVMAYLFCIFNAFQGLCIFVFHCLLQKKVRTEYSRCFSRSTCCRKRGQESYVSNSMSFSKQYTPGRYSAPTAATTHSTTLTTPTANSQLRRMWTETVVNGPRTSDSGITHSQDLNTMPNRASKCAQRLLTNPRMRCATLRSRGFGTTSSSILYFYPLNESPSPPSGARSASASPSRARTLAVKSRVDQQQQQPQQQVNRALGQQRHSATQQFPSSSSPQQLRRASAERLLTSEQKKLIPSPTSQQQDHAAPEGHEDEVFLPAKAREFPPELIGEEEFEYDRLQRHCHMTEACSRDCVQLYHSPDAECTHRHHTGHYPRPNPTNNPPRPQPRSMTMNPLKSSHHHQGKHVVDGEERHAAQFQRSSTLAQKPARQWEDRRPSSPSRRFSHPAQPCPQHAPQERCRDACYGPPEPPPHPGHYRQQQQRPSLEPLHASRIHGNGSRKRRSLNSSDSDDPIVNDFSASSSAGSSCGNPASLSRGAMTRSSMMSESIIHEGQERGGSDVQQERHREPWTPLYHTHSHRDETDLEVQRLTLADPSENNEEDGISRAKKGLLDNQRDSAFYQSMNELSGSPSNHNYSSPSSGCSGELPSGDDDTYRQKRPAARQTDNPHQQQPRYVLSPPMAFKASRNPARNKERVYEDMIIKHPADEPDTTDRRYPDAAERSENRYSDHHSPSNASSLLSQSHHHGDNDPDAGRNSAGSARMMTCL